MPTPGKYLYCLIRCAGERAFGDVAPIEGGDGPVHTISCDGLAAVISNTTVQWYESTRRNILAHQRVLERVMGEFTILPVRFGTVANGASPDHEVRALLERRAPEFGRLFGQVEGRVELGLKALWRDEQTPFEEILTERADIMRLRDALSEKPPAATYYQRIRLGEMVREALERKREAEARQILAPLRRIAERSVENRTTGDRMVANAAFLVDRQREEEFDQVVALMDRDSGDRLAVRYVGPVPPYNFVNITVNWQELRE